jgi:2,3-bisphosphoglycerate-dependent phosphoglycerate mutase
MAALVLIRHGQSQWNLENRFTGWIDVDLSPLGVKEAEEAAAKLAQTGLSFVKAHTSRLLRAQRTLDLVLKGLRQNPPIWQDSALNERHYGELQGLNKDETRKKFGDEQVHVWRRSFDVAPPGGECLADTAKRTLPYFKEYILPDLKAGKNVLVVAHGNSLRSIVMLIENLSKEKILELNIDTAVPYVYEIDASGSVKSKKIL